VQSVKLVLSPKKSINTPLAADAKQGISFSVLNLLDSENEKYVQNVSEDIRQNSESINIIVGSESALVGRTFNMSWRMEFGKR